MIQNLKKINSKQNNFIESMKTKNLRLLEQILGGNRRAVPEAVTDVTLKSNRKSATYCSAAQHLATNTNLSHVAVRKDVSYLK